MNQVQLGSDLSGSEENRIPIRYGADPPAIRIRVTEVSAQEWPAHSGVGVALVPDKSAIRRARRFPKPVRAR